MIVRFTGQQLKRLERFVDASDDERYELAAVWIETERQVASKHRYDVMMPAAGWMMIVDDLFDYCYDARGFRSKDASDVLRRACSAIRASLNARTTHPALQRKAALGLVNEIIPAWKFPGPDASGKSYSPIPVPRMEFVVLGPTSIERAGKRATKWVEIANPPERLILTEAAHTVFC